ncbi:neprilysin-1-like [Ixodes scapularis]|uniref:neprilysin-1-like n=1 Tax=Ixodes scapularis TaxID=6945 RepID=UPI001C394E9E|nr:neprilysin-1-like [Ixodes scapularis]
MAWPDEDVRKNATDLLELLVTLSMTWNVNVLFSYSIKSLSTGKGVITLGMPSSLVPSQHSEAKMSLYEKLIVSLAFLLGRKNDYSDLSRRLISIERDVARFRNESKVSTAFNVRDLGNLCADFPWQRWMLALNKNLPARIALTPQKSIIVHHPSYIGRLLTYFLNHDSPENINAYLALHVLLKYGQATYDIRHVQEIVIYMSKDVPVRDIMSTCQQWMSTFMLDAWNTFVSQALTRPEEIERLSQLVINVKRVFVDRIRRLSWMDARTRNISIQKASNIALSIPRVAGHTSSSNKSSVTLPDLQGDFLEMVCTIVDAVRNDEDLFIGQVIDRSDSVTVHSNVNAVYTYSLNVVNINAALLVLPFYTDDLPVPLNYGGIGTIVAHEIIHGFDASGRLYDDIGEFEDWWSNETSSTYREISACFQEQMQALSPRSGSVTLEENLADNGGVRCAFDAYVFAASQDRRIIQLKGLDSFEEDQLFFLNYCYKFCGVNRDVHPGKRGGESSYPVERLRCNVPLMNLPEFSNAFDCEPGAAMNPSERCSAW